MFLWYNLSKYLRLISTMRLDGRKDILFVVSRSILYQVLETCAIPTTEGIIKVVKQSHIHE